MRYQINLLFFFLLPASLAFSQAGCTDEQASNYDAAAVDNDGSCIYPFTSYDLPILADLPIELMESSGLGWLGGKLYSHDDDGSALLYEIDPEDGEIRRIITLLGGVENTDWEDLAESETHLYIGDFGNNGGNRKDLKIYRINKNDLEGSATFTSLIEFSFADQSDFDHEPHQHNFDCEAFFFRNDSLHLFTKNWLDKKTKHYVVPAQPGNYKVEVRDVFDTGGLVTAADISTDGIIALLGRTASNNLFCWLLFDYPSGNIFGGNKRRIFLGASSLKGQLEGLVFTEGGAAFVSSEEEGSVPARLYGFSTAQWTGMSTLVQEVFLSPDLFRVSPNPFSNNLQLDLNFPEGPIAICLYNSLGQRCYHHLFETFSGGRIVIPLSHLPKGHYFLEGRNSKHYQVENVVRR